LKVLKITQKAGLPDGIFSNLKSQFGEIFKGLEMEEVCISYVRLVYFTDIWYTLWPFGLFVGYLVYFPPFW
jgi:hypothetical protein